jgi:hypothetical protein
VKPATKPAAKPTAKSPKTPKAAAEAKPAPQAAGVTKPAPKAAAKPTKKTGAKADVKAPAVVAPVARLPRSKEKLVRDSFTMPRADFALIQQLKDRGLGFKRAIRKSELLRAGLQALAAMDDALLKALLDRLPALKAGRPRKAG